MQVQILKASGLVAGVQTELDGGGASYTDLCVVLRILGRYSSSTALAFSVHTHQVMIPTWRWHNQNAPVDGLLKRVATEQLIVFSRGGSDWLQSATSYGRGKRRSPVSLSADRVVSLKTDCLLAIAKS